MTFLTKDQHIAVRNLIRRFTSIGQLAPCDIVLLNLIRDLPIDRGFTAITNPNKLNNGARRYDSLLAAVHELNIQAGIAAIAARLPACSSARYSEALQPADIKALANLALERSRGFL